MKKILTRGAAALVLGGCIASCSHDEVDYSAYVDNKLKAYQEVFVDAYGKIDPNQNWGFGTTSKASRQLTRAIDLSFSEPFTFPPDAAADKFLADVPEGVRSYTEVAGEYQTGYANGISYLDPSWTQEVNVWGAWDGSKTSGGILYIKGYNDFSERKFYVASNTEVYLVEGATLVLNNSNANNLQENCKFYVAKEANIITSGELMLNKGLHIYNHGYIEAAKLSTNNNSVLINKSTVSVTGKISVENDLSVIINDGELTARSLNTAGSGKFQNNGATTISDTTMVNSNNNTWINNGQYQTGYFIYNAASDQVINNCQLIVDEEFDINLGDNPGNGCFRMDAGAGVVTKYFNGGGIWDGFNGGPFYIYMGSGSVFKVTETATMSATKANYGIYNLGDDWAVFQAKDIVAGADGQGYEVTYGGKLGIIAESHFANGLSGEYPYIDFKYGCSEDNIYAEGFNTGKPTISIEPSTCNPGFPGGGSSDTGITIPVDQGESSGDQITIETTTEYYETKELIEQGRVFCEDLGKISSNDLDFNDVVFDAYVYRIVPSIRTIVAEDGETVSDETVEDTPAYKTTIVLLAAGGTLPLSIANSYEVHNVLGGNSSSTIINTIDDATNAYGNNWVVNDPVVLGTDFTYESIIEIPIRVQYSNGTTLELDATTGWAPHKILTPIGTKWAKERVKIDAAYTKFLDYVEYSEDCWNSDFEESNLYIHPKDNYGPLSMDPVTTLKSTEGPVITYRDKGTSTTSGGYQGEPVLSRRLR